MNPSPAPPSAIDAWRWRVVWLLFLATLINYMDRLALNNTQAFLLAEFVPDGSADPEAVGRARNQLYARVNFAFGMSFALFQVVAGFLIDRFSLRWLYVGAIAVWSAAGVLTGFLPAGAVALLMACRVALGVGEAFNWPCAVACIRRVIPRESRGLANGIFHSGASIGAVATPFVVLLLVGHDGAGWRNVFILVGAVGVVWIGLWLAATGGDRARVIDDPDPPADVPAPLAGEGGESASRVRGGASRPGDASPLTPNPSPAGGEGGKKVPFVAVFGMSLFWICLVTGVCVNLCWHFYNQWFPRYLTEEMNFGGREQQWVLAGFYIAADLGSMLSGWLTRKLVRAGATVERSRKLVMTGLAVAVAAATVPAALTPGDLPGLKFALFYVVAAAAVGGFAVFFGLAQDIVPRHTAQILGVAGCTSWVVISLIGLAAGEVARPGNYAGLFVAVGCVPLVAAAAGWLWPEPRAAG